MEKVLALRYDKDGTVYQIATEQILVSRRSKWIANWVCQCGLPGGWTGSCSSEFEAINAAKNNLTVHHDFRHRLALRRPTECVEE